MASGRAARAGWLGALFAFSVGLRAATFPLVFTASGTFPVGYDAYYHLRRILWTVENFPAFLDFDPYLAFPAGARAIWTPVFDWCLAAIFRATLGRGALARVESAAMWAPPVLGGIAVLWLFRVARRHFGVRAAWIAAGLLALLPGSSRYGVLGYVDHHVAVQIAAIAILGAMLSWLSGAPPRPRRPPPWLALGATWGLGVGLWPGCLLYVGLCQAALFARWLFAPAPDVAARVAREAAAAHAVAGALILPLCLTAPWEPIRPVVLSGFQPLWFGAGALALAALALGERHLPGTGARIGSRLLLAGAVGGALAGLAIAALPALGAGIGDSIGWLTRSERFQALVTESLPLLWDPGGGWQITLAASSYSFAFFALPAVLAFEAVALRRGRSSPERAMLLYWTTALLVVTLVQRRFGEAFSSALSLELAVFGDAAWRRLRARAAAGGAHRAIAAVALAGALALGLPVIQHWVTFLRIAASALTGSHPPVPPAFVRAENLIAVSRWLRSESPPTDGFFARDAAPEYGVLTAWGDGHALRYHARRPVVQDNFGDDVSPENFELAEAYFAARDEREALAILDRLRVRYVVVKSTGSGRAQAYRAESQFARLRVLRGSAGRLMPDGSWSSVPVPALRRHRLVFESKASRKPGAAPALRDRPEYQVYEIVPGAMIEGRAGAGALVSATLVLASENGGPLLYRTKTVADEAGVYRLRVPYPTESFSSAMRVDGPYRVSSGGEERPVRVAERDVRSGASVAGPEFPAEAQPAASVGSRSAPSGDAAVDPRRPRRRTALRSRGAAPPEARRCTPPEPSPSIRSARWASRSRPEPRAWSTPT